MGSAASFLYAHAHAHAHATVGRCEDALAILRQEFASDADEVWVFNAHLLRAALQNDREAMSAVMTDRHRAKVARDRQLSFSMATMHALGRLRDEALEWLDHTVFRLADPCWSWIPLLAISRSRVGRDNRACDERVPGQGKVGAGRSFGPHPPWGPKINPASGSTSTTARRTYAIRRIRRRSG